MADTYWIRVKGLLSDHWSQWFEGLDIHLQEDGTTLLTGPIVDQSALHGIIARIRDLGLPLVSIDQTAELQN
ncbi:MAG: hypothetical protein IIB77_04650 [Proteobacteria bacterium]|nr:hypothetical protein [Pseudomonadota bacterium]